MIDIWDILDEIKISYVVLDMASSRDASERLSGALLGISALSGLTDLANPNVDYVWLGTGDAGAKIEALNVEDFRIETIHLGTIDPKESIEKISAVSYSANPEENLKRAKKLFAHIREKCKAMMEEGTFLIDFSAYKGISTALKEKMAAGSKLESHKSSSAASRSGGSVVDDDAGTEDMYSSYSHMHNPHACGYRGSHLGSSTTTVVKKVVTTKNFKRTTKYPIAPAIEAMKKKVELVKAGTYEPPTLPALKIDEEKKDEKKDEKKEERAASAENWHEQSNQEFFCC